MIGKEVVAPLCRPGSRVTTSGASISPPQWILVTYCNANLYMEVTMQPISARQQVVRVCSYIRTRFGKREHVVAHWRSAPSH